jgi:hypothetical protein
MNPCLHSEPVVSPCCMAMTGCKGLWEDLVGSARGAQVNGCLRLGWVVGLHLGIAGGGVG